MKEHPRITFTPEEIKKIAEINFSHWNEALSTGDPAKVAEFYAENATFLPTVSGEFERGPAGAQNYFEHFLKKRPSGEIVQEEIQVLGPDCYLHSGMYNFEVGPDNHRQNVKARFTFVWRQDPQGEWRIIHHHSSVRP